MGFLNPVVSKVAPNTNTPVEVYYCPPGKSHAVVDISVLKPGFTGTSLIGLAVTTAADPATLTSVDYFIDDIELLNTVNSAEVHKVIVGSGQRIYAKLMSGDAFNLRLTGVEENNSSVLAAGRLAAMSVPSTNQTKIYETLTSGVSYVSGSLTIYNSDAVNQADVLVWVTSGASPSAGDQCSAVRINATDTVIIENMMLKPEEKIFVQSTQANTEYFFMGMVVGV